MLIHLANESFCCDNHTLVIGLANVPGMNPSPPMGHNAGGGMVMSSFTIRN